MSKQVTSFREFYEKYTVRLSEIMQELPVEQVESLLEELVSARERGSQIILFGNGGSASNAAHFVADFSKDRYQRRDLLFRIICLNVNMPFVTATANDFGYDQLFQKQLSNILQPDDLVIAISSSGNSPNVIRAIEFANESGGRTFGIVGFDGGELLQAAQKSILIPSKKGQYGYMEDVTLILNHILSIYIAEQDQKFVNDQE